MTNFRKELNLDAVNNAVPCCFIVTDTAPEHHVLYANDLFLDMLGYADFEEFCGAVQGGAINCVIPDDRAAVRLALAALAPDQISEITFRVCCKDGAVNYIRQRARAKRLSDGADVVFSSCFNVDQYEQQARRDGVRLQCALSNLHVAVWECDFATRRSVYSPDTVREFGIPPVKENVPESLLNSGLVHPDSMKPLEEMYRAVMAGAPFAEGEIQTLHDGKPQWLKQRLTTIFENGKPVSAIGTAQDITREKTLLLKMEEEVTRRTSLESTLRGKGYYDLTCNKILDYDTSRLVAAPLQELTRYSDAVQTVMAQIPDSGTRKGFDALFAPENLLGAFAEGKTDLSYEYRRITPEGGISWVCTRALLARQPSDGHVLAFMYTRDINEEKIAHEIVDTITTAEYNYILLVDAQKGSYRMFSNSVTGELPLPQSGSDYWADLQLCLIPKSPDDKLAPRSKETVLTALREQGFCEFVSTLAAADGRRLTKKTRYSFLPNSKQYILVTCADITLSVEKETQQQLALESALLASKQASRAKSEFLSRMSHEIRTPMNAILGMAALAVQSVGNDEETMDCISKIGISGHYLLTLINDILDMSRIESGKMLLHNAPFNFPEFISGINTVIYGQTQSKGINYETVIAHGLEDGYIGDAMKLQQVLINILGNAVKFTPAGGKITFSISTVSRDAKNCRLRFAVNDTGCGISEEAQSRIFDAFEQQDSSTTAVYGGTGLGLAISKSLVELMNGAIRVRSIVDIGTEFSVEVPLEIDQSLAVTHTPPAYSFADLHTLIVDDDLMVCEQTAETLKDIGMIPEWVTGGREAVDRVRELWQQSQKYDFILVDWKMPDMDGIETSRRIRRIVGPEVTIIMITAYDWVSIEQEALAAGVNMCISKPMFQSTLVSAFTRATGAAERTHTEAAQQELDFTGKRVLLAEDHPLNAEIAVKLLERRHCTVEWVANGMKALERFTTTPPNYYDAILMDVRMPIMDGLQAATTIRHWDKEDARSIPIIAMTANAFEEDVEHSKAAGMDAHLAKPIDPELLYRVLYRLMN